MYFISALHEGISQIQVARLRKSICPASLTDPFISHGNLKMWSLSNISEQLVVIESQQIICGRCYLLDIMVEMPGTELQCLTCPSSPQKPVYCSGKELSASLCCQIIPSPHCHDSGQTRVTIFILPCADKG